MKPFRWNDHNIEHIAEHGVLPEEAEHVVGTARRPFPRALGDGKYLIRGQGPDGAYLQVVFIFSPPGVIYVIHARPMTEGEKRQFRRQQK